MIPASMPLGPFLVSAGGKLNFRAPDAEVRFTFQWRRRCFAVRLQDGHLNCAVPVGRLPSSTGGTGRREAAMPVLRALGQCLPAGWHLRLLPDHSIQLDTSQDLAWPSTAAALITPLFGMLMHTAPVLDLLEEAGLA